MKTFKKILSVIFIALGVIMVVGLLLAISIPDSASDVKIAAPFMGILGALIILLGIKLWDWSRFKMIIGIISTIIGAFFLFGCIPQFLNSELITAIIQIAYAVIFLTIGGFITINQLKLIKASKKQNI